MFATIRRYQGLNPGQTAETVNRVKEGLLPILTEQPGFASYHAIDAGNEVAISVSIYESRAAADAANQAAAAWVQGNLADLVGPGEVTVGEVLASATGTNDQRNLDLIRQGYEAFGRGDIPGLLALLDDQVVWTTPGPSDLPTAGTRRGHAAVVEFFQTLTSLFDITRFEPKEFIAQGDRVVVIGDDTARVKATGKSIESRWTHTYTLVNGKTVAFEEYSDVTAIVAELRSAQATL
jgi:ketosteroid isomerase-like protein